MKICYHLYLKQIVFTGLLFSVITFFVKNPKGYSFDRINAYRMNLFVDKYRSKEESMAREEKANRIGLIENLIPQTSKTKSKSYTKSEKVHKSPLTNWSSKIRNTTRLQQNSAAKVHIATAADDDYIEGVIGLIKSAYRKSLHPSMIQFEVFLTPSQNLSAIEDLQLSKESFNNKWAIRLHRFNLSEVDSYINKQFKYSTKKGNLKSAHNYIRYILFERLPDVDYCLWIDADIAMNKDVVDFVTEKTRTANELKKLKDSKMENQKEYGLPGKTFRENYILGAFPRSLNVFNDSVYSRLQKLKIKVQGLPHFNAGFLLMNLDLWRKRYIDKDMLLITKVNNELSLWTGFGSQPALNLLLGGKKLFQLPKDTIELNLGYHSISKPKESIYFLHWNGKHKPWLENGFNKHLWV